MSRVSLSVCLARALLAATYILELDRIDVAVAVLEVLVQGSLDLLSELISRLGVRYALDHAALFAASR